MSAFSKHYLKHRRTSSAGHYIFKDRYGMVYALMLTTRRDVSDLLGTLQPNSKLDEEPSFVELFLRFVFVVFVYQKPLAVHSSKQPPGSQSIGKATRVLVSHSMVSRAPNCEVRVLPKKITTLTQPFHEQVLPAGQPVGRKGGFKLHGYLRTICPERSHNLSLPGHVVLIPLVNLRAR